MRTEEERKMSAEEVGELVREYALLGSREVRQEAMEYIRFLREEVAVAWQERARRQEQHA